MIGPLSLEGVTTPRGTKYPLDIHWRKEPPFWRGSIENAYIKAYPKFQGQVSKPSLTYKLRLRLHLC